MNVTVYQQEFGCLSVVYHDCDFIYVDGSQYGDSVGWSVVFSGHPVGSRHPGIASVSMVELTAINEELELICGFHTN